MALRYLRTHCPEVYRNVPNIDKVSKTDSEVIIYNANQHAFNSWVDANRGEVPPLGKIFDPIATLYFQYLHFNSSSYPQRIFERTGRY